MFHYTVTTDKSLDEAVEALQNALKEKKFGVLWDFDITKTLQSKGFDFKQPYRVLEVCNPGEANQVLSTNSLVGYFLPCKIVVYEKDDQTHIGMPKPTTLISMVDDNDLRETAERVESNLIAAIDQAK